MPEARWTQEEVRHFALSLPEAHESSHFGRPDLRVRNKIFATLPEDGRTVNLKTTAVDFDLLLKADPECYLAVWGVRWVGVVLERVEPDVLRQMLVEAWCLAAPRGLAARFRAGKIAAE